MRLFPNPVFNNFIWKIKRNLVFLLLDLDDKNDFIDGFAVSGSLTSLNNNADMWRFLVPEPFNDLLA